MLTAPTIVELADFLGRTESSFAPRVTAALSQAALLFSLRTELSEYPTSDDQAQLARNAIMEMADRIYWDMAYAEAKAKPFTSETIGSYSYSKGSAAAKAQVGLKTGLLWWDLAIELLTADESTVEHGSIQTVQPDLYRATDSGDTYLLGPGDLDDREPFFDYDHADTTVR
jgi:hypothetical protein